MRRPVLAIVANLLIVLAGLAAFRGVEIRELPDVDRPVITIRAAYDGATPETIDRQVTDILEGAASRVPGVKSISSTEPLRHRAASWSSSSDSVDINVAANDLRDAVGNVERQLPDDVDDISIVKADDNSDAIMRLAVTAREHADPGSDAARRGSASWTGSPRSRASPRSTLFGDREPLVARADRPERAGGARHLRRRS